MRKSMQSILGILTGTAIAATTMLGVAMAKPGNTECIAPAGAGGGWDFTCRVPAAQVMGDMGLIDGTMAVTNMSQVLAVEKPMLMLSQSEVMMRI